MRSWLAIRKAGSPIKCSRTREIFNSAFNTGLFELLQHARIEYVVVSAVVCTNSGEANTGRFFDARISGTLGAVTLHTMLLEKSVFDIPREILAIPEEVTDSFLSVLIPETHRQLFAGYI